METARIIGRPVDGLGLDNGSGWRDETTGCWISVSTPAAKPELWNQYLEGALRSYRKHGVESAIDIDAIRHGSDTAVFFAAVSDDGRVVGGTRVVGLLRKPEDSHALVEWHGSEGLDALRQMIANRLPFGIAEVKSAWADSREYGSRALTTVLARTALPSMTLLGAQFVMATAAAHVLEQWRSSGGVVASRIPATTYPNENYRTKVMWWDRSTLAGQADPAQYRLMCAENARLCDQLAADGALWLESAEAE
jgi:hypothetical protein